jgi:hypothetical protein
MKHGADGHAVIHDDVLKAVRKAVLERTKEVQDKQLEEQKKILEALQKGGINVATAEELGI